MIVMLTTALPSVYVLADLVFCLFATAWSGASAALVQDLVLPRMRGSAAAMFAMVCVLVAAGAGPYWAGKVSTLAGSLRTGIAAIYVLAPLGIVLVLLTARRLRFEMLDAREWRAALPAAEIVGADVLR